MDFDYVIVGGGSAGSVLAARLTEDPRATVCLLEAGGEGRGLVTRMPFGTIATLPGKPKITNWAFETVPQKGLNGRRGYQPRGKALGGSSAINAMLYVRGQPEDYDGWALDGCPGWGWHDMLPWFLKSEGNQRGASALHSADGPLRVSDQQTPRSLAEDFIRAAEECQIRRNDDFNGPEQEGVGLYQVTQFHGGAKNGERCSAAAAYLHPVMGRRNLKVMTGVQAQRIIFEGNRAVGVRYKENGTERNLRARREVIISSGAFGSPQLLMLSGIGPAAHLKSLGIDVLNDLPGVGQNLQDHLDYVLPVFTTIKDTVGIGAAGTAKIIAEALRWRRDGTGMLATPFAEGGAFIKSSPDVDRPDLQLHFVLGILDDHARKLHPGYGYSIHVCVLRPKSRGEVKLASRDAAAAPLIDPNYLADPQDAELMLKGVKRVRAIAAAPSLARHFKRELFPLKDRSDAELMEHIRARADTIYHPVGTCRMGNGPMAVVDPSLKVRGIDGLRVIDASIMPNLISGNTNAPTIAIAERMAVEIAAAARG
ncbi:choline dehydrogenase-like flavoprotein [Rhizobium aquaticum]|uniref:Choline dehydrogenase-like flavoprotein n=1 Tax=Rhizobium aquaticum TaxID=1549636 RepID=A0ABV2IVF4_9HYPH